jgi:radical SAM enzyme (TIGR01210 family)
VSAAAAGYPTTRTARDRFVVAHRGPRRAADPWALARLVVDQEPDGHGGVIEATTLFLTGRECPWRCVMCDLWRDTIEADTPAGAIPWQLSRALPDSPGGEPAVDPEGVRRLKLYNAGSFFDDRAVPPADDAAIADAVRGFAHLTVEAHPRLIGDRTWRFRDRLAPSSDLEVAIGLETAHPEAFERLNKGCTLEDVERAAAALRAHGVGLRVFLLVHPPFVPIAERDDWLARSVDAAVDAGAALIALIPTRGGNGAMEALAAEGAFAPPALADLEGAAALAIARAAGRAAIVADLWDLAAFATCEACREARRARLQRQNLEQRVPDAIGCAVCR